MNNKLVLINLSDRQDITDFYNTVLDIQNDINICERSITYNAKDYHAYDFISLSKYILVEIVADEDGSTVEAYKLIKKFEIE